MTKHMQHADDASVGMPFSWLTNLNGSALTGFIQVAETCNKAGLAWQREIARFSTARLQRDSEFGQRLLRAQNWVDAIKLQQDWAAAAGQDYVDEANRLMHLAQEIGADVMRPAPAQHAAE